MGRKGAFTVAVLLAAALSSSSASAAPDRAEQAKQRFAAEHRKILVAAGSARVNLGVWCRDAGLVAQASASFVRAVEESGGENAWAVRVLDLMRKFDDKFWKAVNPHPGKAYLETFEKKGARLDDDRRDALYKLARDGHKAGLVDEAYEVFCELVRDTDKPLVLNDKAQVVVPSGAIPEDVSARMKASAMTVNGQQVLRDEFLRLVPDVKEVKEAAGVRVRVRLEVPEKGGAVEAPEDLLASLEALMPFLEDDLGGRPTKRIAVFVFAARKTFKQWLDAAKMPQFGAASGLADGATNTAIVCGEGIDAEGLRGMCMHEMSHLFMYHVTPVVMPSWYAEGFAETYGGVGTFAWKDAKLETRGVMEASQIAPLRTPEGYIALGDLLQGDALNLLTKDKAGGRRFYAESWAFLRWIRTASSPDLQGRFRLFETICRGQALGAKPGSPREQDTSPAATEFKRRFGPDLGAMETAFREWLKTL